MGEIALGRWGGALRKMAVIDVLKKELLRGRELQRRKGRKRGSG
jgi:hypothetical protein